MTANLYKTTYHRDGTVTVWNVYDQRWIRCAASRVSAETLATLSEQERTRIARIAARRASQES